MKYLSILITSLVLALNLLACEINSEPDFARMRDILDSARTEEERQDGLRVIESEIRNFPDNDQLRSYRLIALVLLFKEEEALQTANADLERLPHSVILRRYRFDLLKLTGRYAEARDDAVKLYAVTGEEGYNFYDCLVREHLQKSGDDYMACYHNIYVKLKEVGDKELYTLYCAAVMLNAPDKDEILNAYLASLPVEMADYWKESLASATRDGFLIPKDPSASHLPIR